MQTKQTWKALYQTQFLGVLNDNLLKNLICFVAITWISPKNQALLLSLAAAALVLPFILLSPIAGNLSTQYSNNRIIQQAKFWEIPIVLLAVWSFYTHHIIGLILCMFLMGIQSALYAPAKYVCVKLYAPNNQIAQKLAKMESLSFIAVLLGTVLAGYLAESKLVNFNLGVCLVLFSTWSFFSAKKLPLSPPSTFTHYPLSKNPIQFIQQVYPIAKKYKGVNLAVLGNAAFWFIASLIHLNTLVFFPKYYQFSTSETALVSAFIAIGIALGCFYSGKLLSKRLEPGMVFFAQIGLGLCVLLLGIIKLPASISILLLGLSAFFGGIFKVPLSAWIQERTDPQAIQFILAYNQLWLFLGILVSALVFALCQMLIPTHQIFIVVAIVAFSCAMVVIIQLPIYVLRWLILCVGSLLYRLKINNLSSIPKQGGGLIVCNHVSMLDAVILLCVVPRNLRFVMHESVYHWKLLHPLFKQCKMIPVGNKKGKNDLNAFTQRCKKEVANGHLVVIFPEGLLNRKGTMTEFKRGIEHLVKATKAPVYPIHMEGIRGSFLSFKLNSNQKYGFKLSTCFHTIHIQIGAPIRQPITAYALRKELQNLAFHNILNRTPSLSANERLSYILKDLQLCNASYTSSLPYLFNSPNLVLKDIRGKELHVVGNIPGSLGRPLPGVCIKIVNDFGVELTPNQSGFLWIKHPYQDYITWENTKIKAYVNEEDFVFYTV